MVVNSIIGYVMRTYIGGFYITNALEYFTMAVISFQGVQLVGSFLYKFKLLNINRKVKKTFKENPL